jgi:hypothetical protein
VEFGVAETTAGIRRVRYVAPDAPGIASSCVIAVRLWLRLRADFTETGFDDDRTLRYANVEITHRGAEAAQRRLLVQRTVALRNAICP